MLAVGLLLIARNPGVPSLQYAVLWLGVMAVARGVTVLVGAAAIAIDLSLLLLCCIGLEIGGLFLIPSFMAFTVGDALGPGRTADI
jgi:hypothetical protein